MIRSRYRPFQVLALSEHDIDDMQLARLRQLHAIQPTLSAALPLSHSFWIAACWPDKLQLTRAVILPARRRSRKSSHCRCSWSLTETPSTWEEAW